MKQKNGWRLTSEILYCFGLGLTLFLVIDLFPYETNRHGVGLIIDIICLTLAFLFYLLHFFRRRNEIALIIGGALLFLDLTVQFFPNVLLSFSFLFLPKGFPDNLIFGYWLLFLIFATIIHLIFRKKKEEDHF